MRNVSHKNVEMQPELISKKEILTFTIFMVKQEGIKINQLNIQLNKLGLEQENKHRTG